MIFPGRSGRARPRREPRNGPAATSPAPRMRTAPTSCASSSRSCSDVVPHGLAHRGPRRARSIRFARMQRREFECRRASLGLDLRSMSKRAAREDFAAAFATMAQCACAGVDGRGQLDLLAAIAGEARRGRTEAAAADDVHAARDGGRRGRPRLRMPRTCPTSSGARRSTSTRSCAAPTRPTFPWSSRPSSSS